MEQNLKFIGELSEEIQSTATKVLPDIKGDFNAYKDFMDQVMKNVRVPDGVTTLFVLLSVFAVISLYNITKMVSALRTHTMAKFLVLYLGFYLFAYSGFFRYPKN
ncbi:hypothetical protein PCYB_021220 [Plasmodium cynomolgi strain B]|uniref:Uncharacterized protein n=1 Tax=Plasmodium cynomolgi (strain B) TaxID=1120755 RepID=K6UI07_PLACD|nr:hypothetical protein PCYB_021220 [Plasmodium cynomolgi strain B]GAB64553.1 hypothetical protein PCYB_021220 [Plasmodium cynomolgi strain B]